MPGLTQKQQHFVDVYIKEFLRAIEHIANAIRDRVSYKKEFSEKILHNVFNLIAAMEGAVFHISVTNIIGYGLEEAQKSHLSGKKDRQYVTAQDVSFSPTKLEVILRQAAEQAARQYVYVIESSTDESVKILAFIGADRSLSYLVDREDPLEFNVNNLLKGFVEGHSGTFVAGFKNQRIEFELPVSAKKDMTAEGAYKRPGLCYWNPTEKKWHYYTSPLPKNSMQALTQHAAKLLSADDVQTTFIDNTTIPKYGFRIVSCDVVDHYTKNFSYIEFLEECDAKVFIEKKSLIPHEVKRSEVEEYCQADDGAKSGVSFVDFISKKYYDNRSVRPFCHDERLQDLDLSYGKFNDVDFTGINLSNCKMTHTSFDRSWLTGGVLVGIKGDNISFREAHAEFVLIRRCDFSTVDWSNGYFEGATIEENILNSLNTLGTRFELAYFNNNTINAATEELALQLQTVKQSIKQLTDGFKFLENNLKSTSEYAAELRKMIDNQKQDTDKYKSDESEKERENLGKILKSTDKYIENLRILILEKEKKAGDQHDLFARQLCELGEKLDRELSAQAEITDAQKRELEQLREQYFFLTQKFSDSIESWHLVSGRVEMLGEKLDSVEERLRKQNSINRRQLLHVEMTMKVDLKRKTSDSSEKVTQTQEVVTRLIQQVKKLEEKMTSQENKITQTVIAESLQKRYRSECLWSPLFHPQVKKSFNDSYVGVVLIETDSKKAVNSLFALENALFYDGSSRRVIITGNSGSGKTALVKKLQLESIRSIKAGQFETMAVINCRHLYTYSNQATVDIRDLLELADLDDFDGLDATAFLRELKQHLSTHLNRRWLFVLEGFDEIDPNLCNESSPRGRVLRQLLEMPDWLITAQPMKIPSHITAQANKKFHIQGLTDEGVQEYAARFFSSLSPVFCEDLIQRFQAWVAEKSTIQPLLKNPVFLDMLCTIFFEDNHASSDNVYQKIINKIVDRFSKKYQSVDSQLILVALRSMAWYGIKQGRHEFSEEQVDTVLREHSSSAEFKRHLLALGLLTERESASRKTYQFIHPSFQGYLAAERFISALVNNDQDIKQWFTHYRYDPRYREWLIIVAELLQSNTKGKHAFKEIIIAVDEPSSVQQLLLMMQPVIVDFVLEECVEALKNQWDSYIHIAQFSAFQKLEMQALIRAVLFSNRSELIETLIKACVGALKQWADCFNVTNTSSLPQGIWHLLTEFKGEDLTKFPELNDHLNRCEQSSLNTIYILAREAKSGFAVNVSTVTEIRIDTDFSMQDFVAQLENNVTEFPERITTHRFLWVRNLEFMEKLKSWLLSDNGDQKFLGCQVIKLLKNAFSKDALFFNEISTGIMGCLSNRDVEIKMIVYETIAGLPSLAGLNITELKNDLVCCLEGESVFLKTSAIQVVAAHVNSIIPNAIEDLIPLVVGLLCLENKIIVAMSCKILSDCGSYLTEKMVTRDLLDWLIKLTESHDIQLRAYAWKGFYCLRERLPLAFVKSELAVKVGRMLDSEQEDLVFQQLISLHSWLDQCDTQSSGNDAYTSRNRFLLFSDVNLPNAPSFSYNPQLSTV